MNETILNDRRRFLSKKVCLWAIVSIGVVDGLVSQLASAHRSLGGLAMFITNVAMVGWCFLDAEERKILISRWLGLTMLALPIVGLPWYFVASRGVVGAVKTGFGLGLFAVWISAMMFTAVVTVVVQTLLAK